MPRRALSDPRTVLLGLLVVGAVTSVGVAIARNVGTPGPSPITTQQSATASDSGVTITVTGATFTGLRTLVELSADFGELESALGTQVKELRVARTSFGPDSIGIQGADDWIPVARRGTPSLIVALTPVNPASEPALVIRGIEVVTTDGRSEFVPGSWVMPLSLPADIEDRLRVEELSGRPTATVDGLKVTVVAATRTSAETFVTVRLEGSFEDQIEHLGEPRLLLDGQALWGGIERVADGGQLLTLAFPPTPFGKPVVVSLGPWTLVGAEGAAQTRVDLTELSQTESIWGVHLASARIEGRRLSGEETAGAGEGRAVEVGVMFGTVGTSRSPDGTSQAITITVPGNFEFSGQPFATLPDGSTRKAHSSNSSYRKDMTGVITTGTTSITFLLDGDLDSWAGPVTILHGAPNTILRGPWELVIEP